MDSDAGWTENGGSSNGTEPSHVEEIGKGKIRLLVNIRGGQIASGLVIAKLPTWAQPTYRVWGQANARSSTVVGVQAASIDISSSIDPNVELRGCVITGLSMLPNWTYMDKVYRI